MKLKAVVLFLCFCTPCLFSQTSLHDRSWDYIQQTIHSIDSSATHVVKQKHSVSLLKSKVKCISAQNHRIKRKTRSTFKKGNLVVKSTYRVKGQWRSAC